MKTGGLAILRHCLLVCMIEFLPDIANGDAASEVSSDSQTPSGELKNALGAREYDPRLTMSEYPGVVNLYVNNKTSRRIEWFGIFQRGAENALTSVVQAKNVDPIMIYHAWLSWNPERPNDFLAIAQFEDGAEWKTNFVASLSTNQWNSLFIDIRRDRTFLIQVKPPLDRSGMKILRIPMRSSNDEDERINQYREAAEAGDADAQFELGEVYASRSGETNTVEAIKWYKKAAEQGHAKAHYKLGVSYAELTGHRQESQDSYRRAAEMGVPEAQLWLGHYYEIISRTRNHEEAEKWYRKAAEQGNAEAQRALGVFYLLGTNGEVRDKEESFKWFQKAAEQGDARGRAWLGRCFADGIGVAKNDLEALKWFRLAAEQGERGAQYSLGKYYAAGTVVEKDEVEAARWYLKSAQQGHSIAQYKIAECYATGAGVEKNEATAIAWYRKSAAEGYPDAYYKLGMAYRQGVGVEKDEQTAQEWFRKAADHGNPQARELLKGE